MEEIKTIDPDLRDGEARNILALFLFRGDDVFKPINALSGGERGRVALAKLMLEGANLLLLDEPTANLDPKSTAVIEETISYINREYGTTIAMATHNLFQAETLTTHVALLLGGRIAQTGTGHDILRSPSKDFASFARLENVFSGSSKILPEGTSVVEVNDGIEIEAAIEKDENGKVWVLDRSNESDESNIRKTFEAVVEELGVK